MQIYTSQHPYRFVPERTGKEGGAADGPVPPAAYLLVTPTPLLQAQYRDRLRRVHRVRQHSQAALNRVLRDALADIFKADPEALAGRLEDLDAAEEAVTAWLDVARARPAERTGARFEAWTADHAEKLAAMRAASGRAEAIAAIVMRHCPDYEDMVADNDHFARIDHIESVCFYCCGFDGPLFEGVAWRKAPDGGGMDPDLLAVIPEADRHDIVAQLTAMTRPGWETEKNSDSPSPGSSSPTSSAAAASTSPGTDPSKTPATSGSSRKSAGKTSPSIPATS